MKTPDDIKKAHECCIDMMCHMGECAYESERNNWEKGGCFNERGRDALAYIKQLENHIGELTEKVAQLEAAQPKWISVEERLPNAGEKVIVRGVKNGMQVGAFSGITRHEKNRRWWWKKNTILEVTHWMPIPSTEGLE